MFELPSGREPRGAKDDIFARSAASFLCLHAVFQKAHTLPVILPSWKKSASEVKSANTPSGAFNSKAVALSSDLATNFVCKDGSTSSNKLVLASINPISSHTFGFLLSRTILASLFASWTSCERIVVFSHRALMHS